jgi:hypothetical protein
MRTGYLDSSAIESRLCFNRNQAYKAHCSNSVTLPSDIDGINSVL